MQDKIITKLINQETNIVTHEDVTNFIEETIVKTESVFGRSITIVHAKLKNGFIITESCTCVKEENYSQEMGKDICMKRIEKEVWYLLGFLLATAVTGSNDEVR